MYQIRIPDPVVPGHEQAKSEGISIHQLHVLQNKHPAVIATLSCPSISILPGTTREGSLWMSFLTNSKEFRQLRPNVLSLYRTCLKLIRDLPRQKEVYYDYTRLKFKENSSLKDGKKIRALISASKEEIAWVRKILDDSHKALR